MRERGLILLLVLVASVRAPAQSKPRESDLKLPIGGAPGPLDAITDVAAVEVGHTTPPNPQTRGRRTVIVVPTPGLLSIARLPPCATAS